MGDDKVIERNEKGEMLLAPITLAKEAGGGERYNGGWVKKVTGLDKKRTNGYSILGDFIKDDKIQWMAPGLYLDCGIGGSRKHQEKYYTLFRLTPDGTVEKLAEAGDGKNWAVKLWPAIEEGLKVNAIMEEVKESIDTRLVKALARKKELEEELARLNEEIAKLTALKESEEEINALRAKMEGEKDER